MILGVDAFREEGSCVELDQLRLVRFRLNVDWRNKVLHLLAVQVESFVEYRVTFLLKVVGLRIAGWSGCRAGSFVEDRAIKFTRRDLSEREAELFNRLEDFILSSLLLLLLLTLFFAIRPTKYLRFLLFSAFDTLAIIQFKAGEGRSFLRLLVVQ